MRRIAKFKRRFLGWNRRLRRVARWLAGGCVATIMTIAAIYPAGLRGVPFASSLALTASLGLLASFPLWLAGVLAGLGWGRPAEVGVVRLERAEGAAPVPTLKVVEGERERLIAADEIVSGIILPKAGGVELRVRLANEVELSLSLRDEEHAGDASKVADELCAQLGLDAGRQRTELHWTPLVSAFMAGFGALSASSIVLLTLVTRTEGTPLHMAATFGSLLLPYFVSSFVVRAFRNDVEVGQDGVRWKRLGRTKRIDFAGLARVEVVTEEVPNRAPRSHLAFHRRDGSTLRLGVDHGPLFQALVARVEAARAYYEQLGESADAPFRRSASDSLEEWAEALRGALSNEASFRQATLRRDDALHVVEDPRAHPEARVGAALALMQHGTPADRMRVRVAAEGTVHPKLRVALTHALQGDVHEEEIEAAAREVRASAALRGETE